jgi:hypothetical protein
MRSDSRIKLPVITSLGCTSQLPHQTMCVEIADVAAKLIQYERYGRYGRHAGVGAPRGQARAWVSPTTTIGFNLYDFRAGTTV